MVTVSIDTDWKPVTAFFKTIPSSMPVYLDPGRTVYNAYHLTGTPETFLIDRNGIIPKHTIGADRWASDSVLAYVDKLIKAQRRPRAPRIELRFRLRAPKSRRSLSPPYRSTQIFKIRLSALDRRIRANDQFAESERADWLPIGVACPRFIADSIPPTAPGGI
jgi:hypothetical protein